MSVWARLKTLERITYRWNGRVPIGPRYLTMADLDEALFAINGVLNFTATITNDNGCNDLHLEVKIAEDQRTMPVIQAITTAVPDAQRFNLRVSVVDVIPSNMAKRTISDRRNHA